MPHVDMHPAGAFCWIELATTDQNAAKNFYGSLFGWAVNDFPMAPNNIYSVFQLDGRDTAAACTLRPDQRSQGVPPNWMVYVAVDSADETASRSTRLGGKVLAPAFDVFDAGRMAVLQDPTGAVLAVWQAIKHKGTGITGVDGTLCWADLMTPDPPAASRFYSSLFGWKLTKGENDDYLHIKNGEQYIGGVPPLQQQTPQIPACWLPYFAVSDCDRAAAKAKQLGAKIQLAPMTLANVGRWAVLADPQGAVFAIFQKLQRH